MAESSHKSPAAFWRGEIGLCAKDRMYGCAATAYLQLIEHDPSADTPAAREQIAAWRALGDVAAYDSHAERAARAVAEGVQRRERRFSVLTRRATRKQLTSEEEAELLTLAKGLDLAGHR